MTEINKSTEATPTPIAAESDWFLQNLVSFSNDMGIEMGITLQVSGVIVSGTLISGAKYFEEFASQFSSGLKTNTELSSAFNDLISSYKKIYEVESDLEDKSNRPPPQYIHLSGAKFFNPEGNSLPTNQGVLWRGRVTEIGGFNLGSFSKS